MDFESLDINFEISDIDNIKKYKKEFIKKNRHLSNKEIESCFSYAEKLFNNKVPIIYKISHLGYLLDRSKKNLYFLAKNNHRLYRIFEITKKSGGYRLISAPRKDLKKIQRWILDNIFNNIAIHNSAFGFIKNRSIVDNAKAHIKKNYILNIDIENFFPSIKFNKVYGIFKNLGYSNSLCRLFSTLCTLNGSLPQGSPASPMISNIVCKRLDARLYGIATKYGFNYSRYADDITFSGDFRLIKLKNHIIKIIESEYFKLSKQKLKITGRGNAQIVTGIIVNEKISPNRKKIRLLRAIVHNCLKYGSEQANKFDDPYFKNRLYGHLAFLKQINPNLSLKWKKELDNLEWEKKKEKEIKKEKEDEYLGKKYIAIGIMVFIIFAGIGILITLIGLILEKIPPETARDIIISLISLEGIGIILKYLYKKK